MLTILLSYFRGGVFFGCLDTPGNINIHDCTIYSNTAYYGSGMALYRLDSKLPSFHFADISFDSNQVPKVVDTFQSAVLLLYIDNVTFEQIEVSNHDTTG